MQNRIHFRHGAFGAVHRIAEANAREPCGTDRTSDAIEHKLFEELLTKLDALAKE